MFFSVPLRSRFVVQCVAKWSFKFLGFSDSTDSSKRHLQNYMISVGVSSSIFNLALLRIFGVRMSWSENFLSLRNPYIIEYVREWLWQRHACRWISYPNPEYLNTRQDERSPMLCYHLGTMWQAKSEYPKRIMFVMLIFRTNSMYIYIYMCVCMCMCVCICVCVCVCVFVCVLGDKYNTRTFLCVRLEVAQDVQTNA